MDKPALYACPLCGKRFLETEVRCSGCLMARKCDLLCCPRCGYSFRERSAVVEFLKKLGKRKAKP